MLESTFLTISTRRVMAVRTCARSRSPTITGLEWLRAARVIGFLLNVSPLNARGVTALREGSLLDEKAWMRRRVRNVFPIIETKNQPVLLRRATSHSDSRRRKEPSSWPPRESATAHDRRMRR